MIGSLDFGKIKLLVVAKFILDDVVFCVYRDFGNHMYEWIALYDTKGIIQVFPEVKKIKDWATFKTIPFDHPLAIIAGVKIDCSAYDNNCRRKSEA